MFRPFSVITNAVETTALLGLIDYLTNEILAIGRTGPSPGFSSRGAKNQMEGLKTRRGGHIFQIQCWMYAATGGPNVKWGLTDFKWGAGHHCPPAGDGPEAPSPFLTKQILDETEDLCRRFCRNCVRK